MKKTDNPASEFDITEIPGITGRSSKNENEIPQSVINRLPRYFRYLRELLNHDTVRISSQQLSDLMGISACQLRQDLKYFGGLGQRGYGYNVKRLYNSISEELGVSRKYTAVIIGAGKLGRALSESRLFEQRGVWIKGVFDTDAEKLGGTVADAEISDVSALRGFCRKNEIDIAVICCPSKTPDELYALLEGAGVKGVWNFSPCEVDPRVLGVPAVNICTGDSLMLLTHEMAEKEDRKK